jgi:Tfp pilus assembly protein PilO
MSLKIIIVPLLILTIIVFSIWILAPAYSDVKNSIAKLAEAKISFENIDQKAQMAEKLSQELSGDSENQNIISSYIPSEKKEEDMINDLNDIAYTQGMAVYNISIIKENSTPLIPVIDPNTGQVQPAIETIPVIQDSHASIGAIGDYDKIKGFLRKLSSLKRYNSFSSIKIFNSKANRSEGESSSANEENSNILKMEAVANFSYLEKVKNVVDIDSNIFTTGQFDLSAVDNIKKNKDTIVPELNTGIQAGRTNPFTP